MYLQHSQHPDSINLHHIHRWPGDEHSELVNNLVPTILAVVIQPDIVEEDQLKLFKKKNVE